MRTIPKHRSVGGPPVPGRHHHGRASVKQGKTGTMSTIDESGREESTSLELEKSDNMDSLSSIVIGPQV